MLSAEEILRGAADRIERTGLRKGGLLGNYLPPDAAICAVEAMVAANNGYSVGLPIIALRKYLGVESITEWNDDPKRTQLQVIQSLRAAATAIQFDTYGLES